MTSPVSAPERLMVLALAKAAGCLEVVAEWDFEGAQTAKETLAEIEAALNAVESDEVRELREQARKRVYGLVALAQEMRDRDTDGTQVGEAAFIIGAVEAFNSYVAALRWTTDD